MEIPTFRSKLRARLPEDAHADFDALCAWEDQMLTLANESAARLREYEEALRLLRTVSHPSDLKIAITKADALLAASPGGGEGE